MCPGAVAADSVMPAGACEQHAELFDPMTGLPGWALLLDRTRVALARAWRTHEMVAILVLEVSEHRGGRSPDLVSVAESLGARLRPDDTLACVDANRFVAVCGDIRRDEDAGKIADRLTEHGALGLSWRVGVAVCGGTTDPEEALTRAYRQTDG